MKDSKKAKAINMKDSKQAKAINVDKANLVFVESNYYRS
jgi:hypothetical protein